MTAKFWVGGTGTWDSTTQTHWALSSNGAGGAAVPVTGDTVTFDASSGGGTVTVDSTVSGLSLQSITAGAFTGTLDFSVNNPNLTITSTMNLSTGDGVRKYLMGTGTFTFTSGVGLTTFDLTNTVNLNGTSVLNTATYVFNYGGAAATSQNVNTGGKALGALQIGARTTGVGIIIAGGGSLTGLTATGAANVQLSASMTITSLTISGSSSSPVYFGSSSLTVSNAPLTVTVSSATISGAVLRNITFAGIAVSATSSIDLGANNMNGGSISAPSGGGGGVIGS